MTIYERIKNRRKELNLSAADVAKALEVSRATVYRYESSEIEKLPSSMIGPLAKVLHTTPAYLMGWEDDEISISEKELLRKYRELDEHGKTLINLIINCEYDRMLNY